MTDPMTQQRLDDIRAMAFDKIKSMAGFIPQDVFNYLSKAVFQHDTLVQEVDRLTSELNEALAYIYGESEEK